VRVFFRIFVFVTHGVEHRGFTIDRLRTNCQVAWPCSCSSSCSKKEDLAASG
jgi:hypothetical protein